MLHGRHLLYESSIAGRSAVCKGIFMKLECVGKQIKILRLKADISRSKLCSGLCSNQLLFMIEDEEAPVDPILLFSLLERLGKSAVWLIYILTAKEYGIVLLRERMEEALRFGRLEEAKKIFRKYQRTNPAGNNKILCMYEDKIMGILALEEYMLISAKYREEAYSEAGGKRCAEKGQERHLRLLDAACAYFLDAVRRTIPVRELSNGGMTRQLLAGNKLLGMTEIENILLYLFVQQLSGKGKGQTKLLLALYHYLEEYMGDDDLRAQYLTKTGMLLGELYLKCGDYSACAVMHENILSLNRKCGMLVCVLPVLEQIIAAYRGLRDNEKAEFYLLHKRNLEEIFQEAGVSVDCVSKLYYTFRPCQYFVEGKVIAAQRKWLGIKQTELIVGIYKNAESLSRIEHGVANADRNKIAQIMERLKIDKTRYSGNLITDEYQILGLEQDIEKHLARRQFCEAGHELYMLEKSVDMKAECNKQLVLGMKNMEEYRSGEKTCEEALLKAKELLELTYPLENLESRGKRNARIPFRNEMYLFNQVCLLLHKAGKTKEAVERMEEMMRKYEGMGKERKFHTKNIHLCCINMCMYLEELNRLDDAEKIADVLIKEEVLNGEILLMHRLFTTKFDVFEKRGKNIELGKKYLKQAYLLSEWNCLNDSKKLEKAIQEKLGEEDN